MKTILIKYADIEKLIVKNNKKPTKNASFIFIILIYLILR